MPKKIIFAFAMNKFWSNHQMMDRTQSICKILCDLQKPASEMATVESETRVHHIQKDKNHNAMTKVGSNEHINHYRIIQPQSRAYIIKA